MAPSAITTEEIYSNQNYLKLNSLPTADNGDNKHHQFGTDGSNNLVLDILKKQIARVDLDTCEPGEEDAFYVADMGAIYRQHVRWKLNLPRVKPFYGTFPNARR